MSAVVIGGVVASTARYRRTRRFTSTAMWTVPAGVHEVLATLIGGGAGGGGGGSGCLLNGASNAPVSGGGGGAGGNNAYARQATLAVTPGDVMPVLVGAGGTGGSGGFATDYPVVDYVEGSQGNSGNPGADTLFGGLIAFGASAGGGQGGGRGAYNSQAAQVNGIASSPIIATNPQNLQTNTSFSGSTTGGAGAGSQNGLSGLRGVNGQSRPINNSTNDTYWQFDFPAMNILGGAGGGGASGAGHNIGPVTTLHQYYQHGPGGGGGYAGFGGFGPATAGTQSVVATSPATSGATVAPAIPTAALPIPGGDGQAPGAGGGGGGGSSIVRGPGNSRARNVPGGAGGAGGSGVVILSWEE